MTLPLATRLRSTLVAALIGLAAGAALLGWAHTARRAAEAAVAHESRQLAEARRRHADALRSDAARREALRQLEILRHAGLLVAADRHAWQRHLVALQARLRLDGLDWEISPLRADTDAATPPAPGALVAATLRLRGEIAHEGQLLQLLARPPEARHGLFVPRRCRLARAADSPALAVDCEIDWISLQLPPPAP